MIILQVAHLTKTPGPVQSLARFFHEKKGANCYQILHPLDNSLVNSLLKKDGKIIAQKKRLLPGLAKYFLSFFLTLKWLKKLPKRVDLAIGMNCFDSLPLVWLRKRKKIKQIVFFNTDFSRRRFANPLLNRLYIAIDRGMAQKADWLCCNTKRTIKARVKEGIDKNKIIYTPNGVFLKKIGPVKKAKTYQPQLVYAGHLATGHDLAPAITALKGTKLKLFIIGSGPDEEKLKTLIKDQNLAGQVSFLGSMSHQKTLNFLKNFSGFGLAPYSQTHGWTYYADPVKIKEYLACLIPPVTNETTEIAQTIKKKNLGFVYQENPEKIFKKIASLDNRQYQKIIKNIYEYQKDFDYQKIYQKAFEIITK